MIKKVFLLCKLSNSLLNYFLFYYKFYNFHSIYLLYYIQYHLHNIHQEPYQYILFVHNLHIYSNIYNLSN